MNDYHHELEGCRDGESHRIPIQLTCLPLQKSDGSWRMIIDCHKLNQVLISLQLL